VQETNSELERILCRAGIIAQAHCRWEIRPVHLFAATLRLESTREFLRRLNVDPEHAWRMVDKLLDTMTPDGSPPIACCLGMDALAVIGKVNTIGEANGRNFFLAMIGSEHDHVGWLIEKKIGIDPKQAARAAAELTREISCPIT
jgi:hypothetical protein